MAGSFHFFALTGLALFTLVAVSRGFARPTGRRVLAATGAAFGSVFMALFFVHGCDTGVPLMQWALPLGCIVASILFVGDARPRLALAIGAGVVMIGLSAQYMGLVHGAEWVGNPSSFTLDAPASSEWHTFLTGLYRR